MFAFCNLKMISSLSTAHSRACSRLFCFMQDLTKWKQNQSFKTTAVMDTKHCVSFFFISLDETSLRLLEKEFERPPR